MTRHLHTCMLCEAVCGLAVELDGTKVKSVRGDPDDPFSLGHICPKAAARAVPLPAQAGECLLIHNHLWHRSGVNRTGKPRRAFTICLMSESIRCLRKKHAPRTFVPLFR